MSVTLPESVDAWRMVSAGRSFAGTLPVSALARLCGLLASGEGVVEYTLGFGRDEFGTAFLDVHAQTSVSLTCQRSLEPFAQPIEVDTRLGLIRDESEEAALPPGVEGLLVDAEGQLALADAIEDELLLALPLVPVNPDAQVPKDVTAPPQDTAAEQPENPFAVLREWKTSRT